MMQQAIGWTDCKDFNKILACMKDQDQPGGKIPVVNGIELFEKIQKVILDYNDLIHILLF